MKIKVYTLIAIALISGLVSGYFLNLSTFQNQTDTLHSQVANLETEVTTLQANCTNLQNNYTQLLILYSDLFMQQAQTASPSSSQNNYTQLYILYTNLLLKQSQTQVRIDKVTWDVSHNRITVVVRNIGNVTAIIESISVRKSDSGSTFYTQLYTKDNSIDSEEDVSFTWAEEGASAPAGFLAYLTEYVIRVTTTTSYQYEVVVTSPRYR